LSLLGFGRGDYLQLLSSKFEAAHAYQLMYFFSFVDQVPPILNELHTRAGEEDRKFCVS
jgi:hypothetical protein